MTMADVRKGFSVEIIIHNEGAYHVLTDPERVKFVIGEALDGTRVIQEGVDFSLEVKRTYE
jgi:hypothetical protein